MMENDKERSAIEQLKETMSRLRGPKGCPWDREQDHRSLSTCLVEECCELLDTIDRLDMEHMKEELGDVLLQVIFHARLAEEKGLFDFDDVAAGIHEKLVRRHPHVFGKAVAEDSAAVLRQWETIKAGETKNGKPAGARVFKELPPILPALLHAWKVAGARTKHDQARNTPIPEPLPRKSLEALDECRAGEILFQVAAACREQGIDPEAALRRYTRRYVETIEEKAK